MSKKPVPARRPAPLSGTPATIPAGTPIKVQGKPHSKGGIKVRAIDSNGSNVAGYYGHIRRRVGDVFVVVDQLEDTPTGKAEGDKAAPQRVKYTAAEIVDKSSWMVRVDPKTPEKVTTIEEAQKVENERIKMRLGLEPDPIGAGAAG